MGPAIRLTSDGVDGLCRDLGAKFAGRPTLKAAILSVLNPLRDRWVNHQGMTPESMQELERALVSPLVALMALMAGPVDGAEYTADQLVTAWEKVRDRIEWLG